MCSKRIKVAKASVRKPRSNPPHDEAVGGQGNGVDASHSGALSHSVSDRGASSCPSVVRVARPEDASEVYRLLLLGHAENSLFPFDSGRVTYFVQRFLWAHMMPPDDPGPRGVIGVIGPHGGHLEAMTMVGICQQWYTMVRHLEEYIVYVDPEHRRSNHGKALIDWLHEQSQKTNLPLLTGILTSYRTEAKVRLYERYYGEKAGAFFLYSSEARDPWEHTRAIHTTQNSGS